MAATSHGNVTGQTHIYEVFCVLCAVKLNDKASRINVRGRSSFQIETELRKLPLKLAIDDNTRLCFSCLRKLKKKVTRLCKTQFVERKAIANYDDCIKRMGRSSKHTIRSDSKDFATVLNKLVVEGAFEFKEGRTLNCFPAMSGDPLDGLDIHSLYKWIGDHKKYIALDKRAR